MEAEENEDTAAAAAADERSELKESVDRRVEPQRALSGSRKRRREWSCPACTLLNGQSAKRCGLCGHRTDTQPTADGGRRRKEGEELQHELQEGDSEGEGAAWQSSPPGSRLSSPAPLSSASSSPTAPPSSSSPPPVPVRPVSLVPSLSVVGRATAWDGFVAGSDSAMSVEGSGVSDWCWLYRPLSLSALSVHSRKVADVRRWLEQNTAAPQRSDQRQQPPQQSVLLLTGPPGCGKWSTVSQSVQW